MDNALMAMGLKYKNERIAELEGAIREYLAEYDLDVYAQPNIMYQALEKLRKAVNHD